MHRCGSGFLLTLAVVFALALSGCLGKSSSNSTGGGVQSITLSPSSNLSLDVGGTQVFSASARDGLGRIILGLDIQFVVESGSPNTSAPLSVASNGNACAGTWDATITQCTPGTSGIAIVRAVTGGVSSPIATVYVHQHIDSIQITRLPPPVPQQIYDCFTQGQTWLFAATALSNNVDITNTVGPVNWSTSNFGVATVIPFVPPLQLNVLNQAQTTAKSPGVTQLVASVSGVTSSPLPYTTCLVKAVYLQIGGNGNAGNSITVNNGSSVPVKAIAIDTLYGIDPTDAPLATPPLTWSTSKPEVASFTAITTSTGSNTATARANLGGAVITASCTPPSCNIGVLPALPIYASECLPTSTPKCPLPDGTTAYSAIAVNVTSTSKPPTYTAWAATGISSANPTGGCADAPGCSSALFSVTPTTTGTNQIGAIVGLPRTPNSMMFNHLAAARLYIGTDQGLMFVDVSSSSPAVALVSNSATPCNNSLCGKVLAISNDGKLVAVADNVTIPHQVYIYNGGTNTTAPIDLVIPNDTAVTAAFSPDQLKLFILTNTGRMYVYSTVDALTFVPIQTTATDVKFSAEGSFAYVAGIPATTSVSGFATCNAASVLNPVTITKPPLALYPLPTLPLDGNGNPTQPVLALNPPNIDMFDVIAQQVPLTDGVFTCKPPVVALDSSFPQKSFDLGQGAFTPVDAELVADGSEMIVVGENIPAVLLFNVSNGTTSSVPLFNGSLPIAASASTDGSQVFVVATDVNQPCTIQGAPCPPVSVHIVSLGNTNLGQGDFQQVPYININDNNNMNMCSNQGPNAPLCTPNLIAIKPQ